MWEEPNTKRKLTTVASILPSENVSKQFSVLVAEGVRCLQLAVVSPEPLANLKLVHCRWLASRSMNDPKMQPYHPKFLGFEQALKRQRLQSDDTEQYSAVILLPFTIETHNVFKV